MELDLDEVPRATVLAMLRAEDALRKSNEMQALYDKASHVQGDQVERFMQRHVLKAFGFAPSFANLRRYWGIRAKYGDDDAELMETVIYLRYAHLLRHCTIPIGAACPDASLLALDGTVRSLQHDYMDKHEMLVVLAGSMT
jgi:hypothetical protein